MATWKQLPGCLECGTSNSQLQAQASMMDELVERTSLSPPPPAAATMKAGHLPLHLDQTSTVGPTEDENNGGAPPMFPGAPPAALAPISTTGAISSQVPYYDYGYNAPSMSPGHAQWQSQSQQVPQHHQALRRTDSSSSTLFPETMNGKADFRTRMDYNRGGYPSSSNAPLKNSAASQRYPPQFRHSRSSSSSSAPRHRIAAPGEQPLSPDGDTYGYRRQDPRHYSRREQVPNNASSPRSPSAGDQYDDHVLFSSSASIESSPLVQPWTYDSSPQHATEPSTQRASPPTRRTRTRMQSRGIVDYDDPRRHPPQSQQRQQHYINYQLPPHSPSQRFEGGTPTQHQQNAMMSHGGGRYGKLPPSLKQLDTPILTPGGVGGVEQQLQETRAWCACLPTPCGEGAQMPLDDSNRGVGRVVPISSRDDQPGEPRNLHYNTPPSPRDTGGALANDHDRLVPPPTPESNYIGSEGALPSWSRQSPGRRPRQGESTAIVPTRNDGGGTSAMAYALESPSPATNGPQHEKSQQQPKSPVSSPEEAARVQILSEMKQACEMRSNATSFTDAAFWDNQIGYLNECIVKLSKISATKKPLTSSQPMNERQVAPSLGQLTAAVGQRLLPSSFSASQTNVDGARPVSASARSLRTSNPGYSSGNTTPMQSPKESTSSSSVTKERQKPTPLMVKVKSPGDFPEGYTFKAQLSGKTIMATVPMGGVAKDEIFVIPLSE